MPAVLCVGDGHVCPKVDPGNKPHAGGPVQGPGASGVMAGGRKVSVVGDEVCCLSPQKDRITAGVAAVFAEGRLVADATAPTEHGGIVLPSDMAVLIG